MSGFFDHQFDGNERRANVNLSTSASTSSTALLSSVRAERKAREDRRRHEVAAMTIQRVWRGRREAQEVREQLLKRLEEGLMDWQKDAAGLVVVLPRGWVDGPIEDVKRKRQVLVRWCERGLQRPDGFVEAGRGREGWSLVLGILSIRILSALVQDPLSSDASTLFTSLEALTSSQTWSRQVSAEEETQRADFVECLAENRWVERLVVVLEKLVAASAPKKKHPLLQPLARLFTAPLGLVSTPPEALLEQLLHTLLAVPALPSSLPIPSLTHLSSQLPLFTILLPLAAQRPGLLNSGRLSSELGKTYFLANLVTFGLTGGMLARYGLQGAQTWIKVIGMVLQGVQEGWGRWVDGQPEEVEEAMPLATEESDDEGEDEPKSGPSTSSASRSRPARPLLQPAVQKKVVLLASAAHLGLLADTLLSPSTPSSALVDFAGFALPLLSAFRGSPRWEGILESLMTGAKGKALEKRLWREGVRGKWSNSGDRSGWDHFAENPSTPCLLFLTHLYNHYLLITPDDEFFDSAESNPFSLDEVLEIAGIWRDLSYWAYTNGVAPAGTRPSKGVGTEEDRALLTRGVTRVSERNARRKFADEDFWVMVHSDLRSFIDVAVVEDAELTGMMGEEEESSMHELPRWARARQKFSKRQMAYISPRLGLLNNLPMTVPFMTRLEIFRNFIRKDRNLLFESRNYDQRRIKAKIRRSNLAQDGFDALNDYGPALKGDIYIKFYDQFGDREAGIDGGGLFKEFLTSLSKEVFDTNRGLWLFTEERQLYPNPHSYATEPHQLQWYGFIGRVLGKALYEGILVDVSFADFFLAKWLGRQSYLDDLNSLDKELYKGLIILKNYPKPEELALNFTITEEEFGTTNTIDLIPGGAEVPVTAENRHEYIQLVCRHKLDRQIAAQSRAFFSGLSDIIDPKWLRMFDQRELRQLIGGEETMIDIDDLKANCEVSGFPDDNTMRMFWRVVKGFNQEERKALLRFVTSCSRPPLLGFAYLNPKFGVRWSGSDTSRLPSASACFNLLKLPGYADEASLRSKLLQAINSGAGFDLS